MDGAGFWRQLFRDHAPAAAAHHDASPSSSALVFTFTDMIVVYVLTRGGPYDTTQVLLDLAFFTGIQGGDLAEGAAISLFLFPLLLAAVAMLFLRIARRTEVTC